MTTLELQKLLNTMLAPAGYTKLTEDGVLGPKTCGACRMFMPTAVPTECSSKGFTDPTKAGSAPASSSSSSIITQAPSAELTTAGMASTTKWIIGGSVAVALGLVGVAVAKQKGWLG